MWGAAGETRVMSGEHAKTVLVAEVPSAEEAKMLKK